MTEPRPASMTQQIAAAMWAELGRQKTTIDRAEGLESVTITVSIDRRRRAPRRVIFRLEAQNPAVGEDELS